MSPVAAIGLSFLSGCYRHAGDLIRIIGDDEINTEMLVELDRLVQLIESPLLARELPFCDAGELVGRDLFVSFFAKYLI